MREMSVTNILIVEDDSDIREGVRILLESEGYNVEEAEDGFAALELLSEKTDLVILDVMMPGISGIKTCEEIRKKSYVPILFLTAKSQESDKLIGLMAGGDDYLSKPFSMQNCLAGLKHFCGVIRCTGERNPQISKVIGVWNLAELKSTWNSMRCLWMTMRLTCQISNTIYFF